MIARRRPGQPGPAAARSRRPVLGDDRRRGLGHRHPPERSLRLARRVAPVLPDGRRDARQPRDHLPEADPRADRGGGERDERRDPASSSSSPTCIAIVPSARLSDRIGRKPVIYASCVVGVVGLADRRARAVGPGRCSSGRPVRRLGRDVPRGRLGADHRHHPAGLVGPVHGPVERRDRLVDGVRGHDRRADPRLRQQRRSGSAPGRGRRTSSARRTTSSRWSASGRSSSRTAGARAREAASAGLTVSRLRRRSAARRPAASRSARRSPGEPWGRPDPARTPPRPRPPLGPERRRAGRATSRSEPAERLGLPPQHRHERPQEDDVVEPDRAPPEADERLQLGDRPRQGREAEQHRDREEQQAPQPGPRRQDRPGTRPGPTSSRSRSPTAAPASSGPLNWAPHRSSVSGRLMLPVSRFAPNGKPSRATRIAVSSGRRRYAQWIVQSRSEDRPAAPDVPGDVPRQQRPRREQRQHPRGVDVGQERAGRAVRVAAAEPDPDGRPVRPGIGAGRLAAGDEPGREAAERDDQQRHREDPAPVVEPADLVAERPPEDRGRAAGAGPGGRRPRPRRPIRRRAGRSRRGLPSACVRSASPRGSSRHGPRRDPRRTGPHRSPALSFRRSRRGARASVTDGTVIIIGGAEDKVRDRVILNRFVTLAGGRDATIVVISTASSLGTEAGERYRQIFTRPRRRDRPAAPRDDPAAGQRRDASASPCATRPASS